MFRPKRETKPPEKYGFEELYLKSPVWGPLNAHGWGTSMEVVLNGGDLSGGSKGTPPEIHMKKSSGYISGHLLNEELGGWGEKKNMVPLTNQANSLHATYENYVKLLITIAKYLKAHFGKTYGVYYRVVADDKWTSRDFGGYAPVCLILDIELIQFLDGSPIPLNKTETDYFNSHYPKMASKYAKINIPN